MDALNLKEIRVKEPFKRVTPFGYMGYMSGERITTDYGKTSPVEDRVVYQIVTQADFLREYEPSGHRINDPLAYPDKKRKNPETGETYTEYMVRCAFAFQRIISVKQLTHLCGNDIQFDLTENKDDKRTNEAFFALRKGWAKKDMEIAWYEVAKSVKITGDGAFVGYMKGGEFYWKVLSYKNGDTLYPHYDSVTGKLSLFAREYLDYDADGKVKTSWMEVWDDRLLYRFKRETTGVKGVINIIKDKFGIDGYTLVSKGAHGFNFIPVAYKRADMGACWSPSQDTIEQYELAFSQLSQNNMAYAFPIMYFKGDNVNIVGDSMTETIKAITMDKDDDAGFLQKQDASTSFDTQLNNLYKLIYEQSFTVTPPELKSGDLPGVAIKLLYSPAVEYAMKDSQEYNKLIDDMVDIFKEGYGIEQKKTSQFNTLSIYAWIKPYIHQNMTELVTNLATAVQNGFLSRQTASERISEYAVAQEWDRVIKEKKEEQQADLLYELETMAAKPKEEKTKNKEP
jgi:hypothetical protein